MDRDNTAAIMFGLVLQMFPMENISVNDLCLDVFDLNKDQENTSEKKANCVQYDCIRMHPKDGVRPGTSHHTRSC